MTKMKHKCTEFYVVLNLKKAVVNITVQSSLFEYGNVAGVWAGGCMYSLLHDKLSIFYGRVAVNRTS